jgi:dihydrofolate synthase/folylpolyglutamate synthase
VRAVIDRTATERSARLVYAPEGVATTLAMQDGQLRGTIQTGRTTYGPMGLGLRGRHQVDNVVAAVCLLEELEAMGRFALTKRAITSAVEDVVWPARLEWRRWQGHDILIDGAHNPAGARALSAYVSEVVPGRVPIVVGAMRDKNIDGILEALAPVASSFFCTAAASPRAATAGEVADRARRVATGIDVQAAPDPMHAVAAAMRRGRPVVIAGSLFLAGEIRANLP